LDLREDISGTSKVPKLILLPRFSLAALYLWLGTNHLLYEEVFRRTLELPANNGILFNGIISSVLDNTQFFFIVRYFAVILELSVGLSLLFGFLLRFMALLSTLLLTLITLSLIPNRFMLLIHGLPLLLSIPLIFINSNLYSPGERFVPPQLKRWQAR
jgi:uncharacterized membrane protein YphA (DoxX/SURF4 family)